jgi:hypothetical protein
MSESDLSQAWEEYLQGYGDKPDYPMGPEPKSNRPDPTKKYTIDEFLKEGAKKPEKKGGKTRRSRRKHRKSKRRHTRKH